VPANEAGAAAVMVAPPFYDAQSWDELLAHFGAVSDAIDIPIMYYNIRRRRSPSRINSPVAVAVT
jgi:dihydrodipicolinate synthase/N-acetylneuraminate lyase